MDLRRECKIPLEALQECDLVRMESCPAND